jgi:hypothetical protein
MRTFLLIYIYSGVNHNAYILNLRFCSAETFQEILYPPNTFQLARQPFITAFKLFFGPLKNFCRPLKYFMLRSSHFACHKKSFTPLTYTHFLSIQILFCFMRGLYQVLNASLLCLNN